MIIISKYFNLIIINNITLSRYNHLPNKYISPQYNYLFRQQVLIMFEKQNRGPTWATHYKFIKFKQFSEHFISKDHLKTWLDLKYELNDHVGINYRFMDITVNGKLTEYNGDTPLEDVNITQNDTCYVLKKPNFNEDQYLPMKKAHLQTLRISLQRNNELISIINNDPFNKKSMENIKKSKEKQTMYNILVRQFSKQQCLIAFQELSNQNKIKEFLLAGKAKQSLKKKKQQKERQEIDTFLSREQIKTIKKTVFNNDKSPQTYGLNMRILYQKYPFFKKLQQNNQIYIQKKLLGKQLFQNADMQKKVKDMLARVAKRLKGHFITESELNEFKDKHLGKRYSESLINDAILQSGNNLNLAEKILTDGKVENKKNIIKCLKKPARINLILQFFCQPAFDKVLPNLKGNQDKCLSFVNFIVNKYKQNTLLVALIQKYKLHIVSVLSSIYSLKKEEINVRQLPYQNQLSTQEQAVLRQAFEQEININIVEQLIANDVSKGLAVSAVRAAENDISRLEDYIFLGGINKRFDFQIPNYRNQQYYLYKYFRKQKELLTKLRQNEECNLWVASTKQKSPFLYEMILRNKLFFDKIVKGEMDHIK